SLVALHMAAQALRRGECSLALAGGVTVMATPATFAMMGTDSAGAADGRCKAFSAEANGAGWSEGAGMLVLERLSDARRNGHPVLALLKGSAVNQDGKSQGLSAPNGPAQERVIRQALASARLAPQDIDAVEAHGTGTTLGDPIEAQALLATYGEAHAPERPLWLGSLKSNIGHAQAAAGVGGVIKMVLALQNGLLPRTLHAENPSPHIDWSSGTVRLLTQAAPWTANGRPRRAGVSSFGISGTNAHVILEEAPAAEQAEVQPSLPPLAAWPFLLSAKREEALKGQAERLREHVLAQPDRALVDLAYSLATTRTRFEHRAAILADSRDGLLSALEALAQGRAAPQTTLGRARGQGKVAFVFPGQGSQWQGMALSLLDTSPVFRAQIEACEAALAPHVDWSLLSVLNSEDESLLDRIDVVQPALFAVMVALAAVWRAIGVAPDAVVGHSQGEVAAAVVAGALSLEDGAKIVALRSQALNRLAGKGGMIAVELGVEALRKHLSKWGGRLSVAAINSPQSTLVSGDAEVLDAVIADLTAAEIFARKVRVDYASHCAQVEAVHDDLLDNLADLSPRAAELPLYSTVTGAIVDGSELDADYWYRNLRQIVRFGEATEGLLADGFRFFVEVSPHPVLTLALQETLEPAQGVVVGSLRRDEGGQSRLLLSLAELYTRGLAFDWPAFFAPHAPRRVDLPTYAFQRERFWLETPRQRAADLAAAGQSAAKHPLLAAAVSLADSDGFLLTGRLSLAEHPWLADHAVFGTPILPGTAFVEMALLAAQRAGLDVVEELTLEAPLALPAEGAVQLQLSVGASDGDGRRALSVHARAEGAGEDAPWTRHAGGLLAAGGAAAAFDLRQWPPAGAVPLPLDGLYEGLAAAGLSYGPGFQGLRAAWRLGETLFAEATLPDDLAAEGFALHPALLDAALHALALGAEAPAAHMPFSWSGVSLRAVGATTLRVRLGRAEDGAVSLAVADAAGDPVAAVEALAARPVTAEQLQGALGARQDSLYHLQWTPAPLAAAKPALGVILGQASVDDPALSLQRYADLAALQASLEQGAAVPGLVVVPFAAAALANPADAHRAAEDGLALLQAWIADDRLAAARLVLLTGRAVATRPGEDVLDLAHAPLWGLARTAQNENPDLSLFLVDTDGSEASQASLAAALETGERQCALRNGQCLVPRLGRQPKDVFGLPDAAAWRLHITTKGSFDGLALIPHPEAQAPLAAGQVRIAVHAAGLNFHDVLDSLGMLPGDDAPLGGEGAGIVTEVGPGVQGFAVGDRVMGLFPAAFGPVVIADARMITSMPKAWSFAQGASVPITFLTAFYGLVDLADLKAGERVLIHAAAGGVGTAAVQIARHLGAEVFATASRGKWHALQARGFDDA
ncbi:MAG TPA: acyltransferase domain-containing protein, partial [Thermoanaerobaculia bacterium]|nr:acyltransferase domain-containing protein [Thermoanaerobaculia bacterium]